jgi:hypothetical protein
MFLQIVGLYKETIVNAKLVKRTATLPMLCVLGVLAALAQEPSSSATNLFIQMLPRGLYPQQMTVTHGKITLLVQNRSTAPNVTLDLDQTGGNRMSEVSMLPHQHRSDQTLTLSPGTT